MNKAISRISIDRVETAIVMMRGDRVILDADLAVLYDVETRSLLQAVKRNSERFPSDFMFQLTRKEFDFLRSQIVISKGRGGRRYLPYAFTEHGAIMAANVLNSKTAVSSSVQVVRAFIRLRHMLVSNAELARKLEEIERKYDAQFNVVFGAIRELMTPIEPRRNRSASRRPRRNDNQLVTIQQTVTANSKQRSASGSNYPSTGR